MSKIARLSSGSLDKTLNFISKRKYTISQRKLKLLHGSPLPYKKRDIDFSSLNLRKFSISLKSIKEKESILKREPKGESLTGRSSTFQRNNSGFLGNIKKE